MPAARIPDRIVWAVEMLSLAPADHVLEIGCGHGFAVPLVCAKLGRGTLTAIDRSRTMVAAASKRNADLVESGKVRFEAVALADADVGARRFSKIFAINVNVFWLDPSRELPVVRRLLGPKGALYLIYEPPSPSQLKKLSVDLARNLAEAGFNVDTVTTGRAASVRALCMIARPSRSKR